MRINGKEIERGLFIKEEPMNLILSGKKTWELRGRSTKIRGLIGLIQSKTGKVVGTAELVDCKGPLSIDELMATRKHGCKPKDFKNGTYYENTYAWVLKNATRLKKPIPFKRKPGAIVWINF